jgi:adenine/guanine phosphoribosyltransferase-like PRPP-binding protein
MRITIASEYEAVAQQFQARNPAIPCQVSASGRSVTLEIADAALSPQVRRQVRLHFSYLELFEWQDGRVEDVCFWERAERFPDIARDFAALTADLEYDLLAPIEARGFLLAGMLAQALQVPLLPVRRDKPSYAEFAGARVPYVTWRGEPGAVFVFSRPQIRGKRALVVDDLLDTGRSLAAAIEALTEVGCVPAGVFCLCDVLRETRRASFAVPVRAFVRPRGMLVDDGG